MPTSVAEVRPRYELGSGTGELDLSGTGLKAGQTLRTGARVGAGEIKVVVPANAVVEVRADVGMGEMSFPRALDADGEVVHDRASGLGTNRKLTLRPFDDAKPEGTIVVELSAGAGRVEIVRALPSGERTDTGTSSGGGTRQSAARAEPGVRPPRRGARSRGRRRPGSRRGTAVRRRVHVHGGRDPMRHRFEPSRLLLGLAMIAVAVLYLLDAAGEVNIPFWLLLVVVPGALVLAGLTALATFLARRSVARRREQREPGGREPGGYGARGA